MKIGLKKSLLVLSAAVFFAACTPVAHKEIGEQRNILSSLEGTWKLTKATQVDEAAKAKGFPFKELDITNLFPYTDFKLTLTLNAGAPGTFTTIPGASPKIIKLTSGTWTVDDAQHFGSCHLGRLSCCCFQYTESKSRKERSSHRKGGDFLQLRICKTIIKSIAI